MGREEGHGPLELLTDNTAHFGIDRLVRRGAGVAALGDRGPEVLQALAHIRTNPSEPALKPVEFRESDAVSGRERPDSSRRVALVGRCRGAASSRQVTCA